MSTQTRKFTEARGRDEEVLGEGDGGGPLPPDGVASPIRRNWLLRTTSDSQSPYHSWKEKVSASLSKALFNTRRSKMLLAVCRKANLKPCEQALEYILSVVRLQAMHRRLRPRNCSASRSVMHTVQTGILTELLHRYTATPEPL